MVHELEVSVRRRDGLAVIDLSGDVNASGEHVLDAGYDEAAAGGTDVALNFQDVDYINSTGIALIVGLLARARKSGIGVRAFGLSEHYRGIFEITRLSDFMTITEDEDGALRTDERTTDA
ncbi:MAG TPA: STAS domain-containing protein [Nocardioides sp.]|nr:STAS domain-containing protein [Nocardioides sp.]